MTDLFDNILAQQRAIQILRNALAHERLAGSYLFVGPTGIGKTTTAKQFAAAICGIDNPTSPDMRMILEGKHPDVRMVQPSGRSHTIHVGQLWPRGANTDHPAAHAMLRDLHFEPVRAQKRVFIIREAEGLSRGSENAANSILKSLEEPPPYAHFILTASSLSSLLPTIISRCQVVPFSLLPPELVEKALVERFGVGAGQARFLAGYTEGKLGEAVQLARSGDLLAARDEILDVAERLIHCHTIEAFKCSDRFRKIAPRLKAGDGEQGEDGGAREPLKRALEILATFYRDLLAVRSGCGDERLLNSDRHEALIAGARRFEREELRKAVERITGARLAVERNAYAQTVIDVLFLELVAHTEKLKAGAGR